MEYFLIYLLVKLDSIRAVFDMLAENTYVIIIGTLIIAGILAIFAPLFYMESSRETRAVVHNYIASNWKKVLKVYIWLFVAAIALEAVGKLLPSPKEAAIIIGGGATLEILSSDKAKEIGGKIGDKLQHELDKYLSIPEEAPKAEAKVEGQGV